MPPSPPDPYERVAADPLLRQAIQAARSCGTSLSRFLGAEATTRYRYDGAGRLVASTSSPEWTDDDRELLFALMAWEAALCPGCSHPLSETTLPENELRYRGKLVARCHRCTALDIEREKHDDTPHASALLLDVVLEGGGDA